MITSKVLMIAGGTGFFGSAVLKGFLYASTAITTEIRN